MQAERLATCRFKRGIVNRVRSGDPAAAKISGAATGKAKARTGGKAP